jgi:hypothetical protein
MRKFLHEDSVNQCRWFDFLILSLTLKLAFQGSLQPDYQLGFVDVWAVRHVGKLQGALHPSTANLNFFSIR